MGSPHTQGTTNLAGEPLEHHPLCMDASQTAQPIWLPYFKAVIFLAGRGGNTAKSSPGLQRDSRERRDMFIFPAPTSTSNVFFFFRAAKGNNSPSIHPSPWTSARLPAHSPARPSAPISASPDPRGAPTSHFPRAELDEG